MTEFTRIIDPQTFDLGIIILVLVAIGIPMFVAVKLRLPATNVLWAVSLVVFVFSFLVEIPFEYFWISLLLTYVTMIVGAFLKVFQ